MSYHFTSVLPLMDRTAMCTRSRETAQLSVKQNSDWLVVRNYQHNLTFSVIHNQNGGEKIEKREKQVIETVAVHDLKWNPYIKLLFWFSWWFVCVLHLCVCHTFTGYFICSCLISYIMIGAAFLVCTILQYWMKYSNLLTCNIFKGLLKLTE